MHKNAERRIWTKILDSLDKANITALIHLNFSGAFNIVPQ